MDFYLNMLFNRIKDKRLIKIKILEKDCLFLLSYTGKFFKNRNAFSLNLFPSLADKSAEWERNNPLKGGGPTENITEAS